MVDGLLLIDKQKGPTSHDVIDSLRKLINQKRIGHSGTLDPAATGLLVVLVGKATRLAKWMQKEDKTYSGTFRLGIATDTLDATGKVLAKRACGFSEKEIQDAAKSLTGTITQTPPNYSAIKVSGKRAYKVTREGGEVKLLPRAVEVNDFIVQMDEGGEYPSVTFSIKCSSGTYIRTIASDFGAFLGCPAHLENLRRLEVGHLQIKDSVTLEALSAVEPAKRSLLVKPMRDAVDMPEVFVSEAALRGISDGCKSETLQQVGEWKPEDIAKIVREKTGDLVGLGKMQNDDDSGIVMIRPIRVFI